MSEGEGPRSMELPSRMQFRFREINKILKQTVTLIPNTGQQVVNANDTIIVELPHNSVVDLATFQMEYEGSTAHLGKTNAGAGAAAAGYQGTRFFPRNSASIIEQLDVEINGQTRFTLNNYNLVWNILHDYSCAQDSINRRKCGENSDPSSKFISVDGVISERRGYSTGLIADGSALDKEIYVIRSWLGLIGSSSSTTIIDTNILGSVVLKIRLAPTSVLILGRESNQAIAAVAAADSENGLAVANMLAGAVNPAQDINYTLDKIKFTLVRYDLPSEFYMTEASRLASGAVFKWWFDNYSVQSCQAVNGLNKRSINRTSISTRSLNWVMGTFRVPNYTANDGPNNTMGTAPSTLGSLGQTKYTWDSQVRSGLRRLFNNAKYFIRNGSSIKDCTWIVGNSRYPSRTVQQQFDALLQHFNVQNDVTSGIYPGIQSIHHFQETFYADLLSLNCNQSETDYVISGLNTEETPLQITWEVESTQLPAALDIVADANCNPYLICGYTSCIEIRGGRQITVRN
jgi:hypothetical protein